jgi:hypothetical protein
MSFLRFVVSQIDADSGVERGLIGVAYTLREREGVQEAHRFALRDHLAWFEKHLPIPRHSDGSMMWVVQPTSQSDWWRHDRARTFS